MKLKLITDGVRHRKCPECKKFYLTHYSQCGGSSIIRDLSNRRVDWKCINCSAEFKEVK